MIGSPDDASASTMVLPVVPSNRWCGIQLEYPMQLSFLRRSAESMLRRRSGTWMTFWRAMWWSPTGSLIVPAPSDLMLGPAVVTSVVRSSYVRNHSFREQKWWEAPVSMIHLLAAFPT